MRLIASLALAAALAACSPPSSPTPEAPSAESATLAPDATLTTVSAPAANARVTSPLAVTGTAPANWYFENQFPVRLVDAQGVEIAMAPATPRVNWTENAEPKEFDAQLSFSVTRETPATLVLQEDMPGEGEAPREVRVPVILAPN
ncbi:Gmad2 immunoglobulin-like domain-containing protein [Terricaulis silvestris]|uniref:Bacterial spore germination immunoglobulin-like domain-containing protein n=1 Tax=Terricaulis silvestris TaxID=2686094 RepID=A0A6I6MMC5_9CAUL|nr:Gmad2 immunoglobulin-like domain-containing protein [Terricaulis silvestris]QGZ94406.1 hypothetical protein DSM104635_01224 [Terricaulis silvestris]